MSTKLDALIESGQARAHARASWDGPRLRAACKLLGVKTVELAEALGVSQPTISAWIGGRNAPPPELLPELERFMTAAESANGVDR